jgi:hypothetical protein
MVNWNTFVDAYTRAIGISQLSPSLENNLRSVLGKQTFRFLLCPFFFLSLEDCTFEEHTYLSTLPYVFVVDYLNSGFVTVYKFAEFLKGFGPLKQSILRVKDILSQPWFHGFLTNDEADRLLEPCEVGTFLVRFSKSTPGSFAINLKVFLFC